MELYQIRYFLSAARTLNFTRAAEECFVSQPSLTRAIQRLEAELGGELFRRERRRTHLTSLGQAMIAPLRQSLESAELAKAQAESFARDEVAILVVGLSETVPLSLFADALRALQEAFPGLQLSIVRSDAGSLLEQLESGDLELALTAVEDATWERLDIWPLYEESIVFWTAAENSIVRLKSVSISDLRTQTLVSRSYCESADKVLNRLQEGGLDISNRHSINRDRDFEVLVASGMGSGFAPRSIEFPNRDFIEAVSVDDLQLHRTVSLFAVAGRQQNSAVRTGINLIRSSNWAALLGDKHKPVG